MVANPENFSACGLEDARDACNWCDAEADGSECVTCPKADACDEIAMIRHLDAGV